MWKAFDAKSWSALLSSLAKIKKTADESSSAVSGLGEDLAEMSQTTAQTLQEMSSNIDALQDAIDQLRQDIESGAVTVRPVFPVVADDPASPQAGEAWIKT